jgi:hypothetical protein
MMNLVEVEEFIRDEQSARRILFSGQQVDDIIRFQKLLETHSVECAWAKVVGVSVCAGCRA